MTAFSVRVDIGDQQGQRFQPVDALVDTGSTYTWIARSVLEGLDLRPIGQREFELADGRRVFYDTVWTMVRLDGNTLPTLIIFGDEGTQALLGVVTLEEFGLGVDAVNERLIPTPGLLKGLGR